MRKWVFGVLLLILVLQSIAGVYLVEGTIHLPRRELSEKAGIQAAKIAGAQGAQLKTVRIDAKDGISLCAWYFYAGSTRDEAVLLLHGQGDNRSGMMVYIEMFLRNRFRVLAPDSRAHGDSGGAIASYGIREKDDLVAWVEWLKQQGASSVYALGESMGAAILLYSLPAEPRFTAVAAECSFASLPEIALDRVGQRVGTGPWPGRTVLRPAVESAFLYTRIRYSLNFREVSPMSAVANSAVPVLLIHGTNDRSIDVRHSRMIASTQRGGVVLWEVRGAGHTNAFGRRPREYERRLLDWFRPRER